MVALFRRLGGRIMFFRKQKQIDELKRQLQTKQIELVQVKRQLYDTKLLLALETGSYPKNIKIDRLETKTLSASGWYSDDMSNDLIKKKLAYEIADKIIEEGLLTHILSLFPHIQLGNKRYHTAKIEIVKRG